MVDIVRIKDRLAPRKARPPGAKVEAVVLAFARPQPPRDKPKVALGPHAAALPVQGPSGDGKPAAP